MDDLSRYPMSCRRNIRRLMNMLTSDADSVYRSMLTTAILTDLRPEDDKVADLILMDYGIETEIA